MKSQVKPQGNSNKKPHILVVEDENFTRKLVTNVLETKGYSVEQAWNGHQALELARAKRPDLVITDVLMPEVDGFTFVKSLRADPKLNRTPVIFLSQRAEAEYRVRGFRLGADDYLPKPFYPEELLLRVSHVLERAKALKKALEQSWSELISEAESVDESSEDASVELTGDLEVAGLSVILGIVEQKSLTGVLSITKDDDRAVLELRGGALLTAVLAGQKDLEGRDAVYEILGWESGEFAFKAIPVDSQNQINAPLQALLLEGARRIDEAAR